MFEVLIYVMVIHYVIETAYTIKIWIEDLS